MTKSQNEIISGVIAKLNAEGYTAVPDTIGNNVQVTGFTLSDDNISLVPSNENGDKTKDITVSLTTSGENNTGSGYLVTIGSVQHKMRVENGKIEIDEEPVNTNVEPETYKLTVTPTDIVTTGKVILSVNNENITEEKTIDIANVATITVSSSSLEIRDVSDLISISLKNNLNTQIGEVKNVRVAVEKIYDFDISRLNCGVIGYSNESEEIRIPETFIGDGTNNTVDGRKYRINSITFKNFSAHTSSLKYCTNLKKIYIPKTIEFFGENVFEYNRNLTDVYYDGTLEKWHQLIANKNIFLYCGNYIVHCNDGICGEKEGIYDSYNCEYLGSWDDLDIDLSKDGEDEKNKMINLKGNNGCYKLILPKGLTKIGNNALRGTPCCAVILPDTLEEIGDYAFYSCNLKGTMNLPEGLKSIGSCSFQDNSSLDIVISSTVDKIGSYAFSRTGIKNAIIPEGVTTLPSSIFYKCSYLESLVIPKSVIKIEQSALSACGKLKDIYYKGTEEEWNIINKYTNWPAAWNYNTNNYTIHYEEK